MQIYLTHILHFSELHVFLEFGQREALGILLFTERQQTLTG
jgi:hypothetical protein